MINETTVSKLNDMRLAAMADTFRTQLTDSSYQELSFEERFGLIVDIEWARRKNNKLAKLIKKADFKFNQACIEDIEYHADRKLDKTQITRLSSCQYIAEKHNIIILGASGNGKSYMGCAFGIAACRNYYTVKYVRLPDLLDELAVARGEGIFKKTMKQYKNVSLLILDEWLLTPLKGNEARDLLEIVEARHQNGSTIFCSQFSPGGWHEKIGEDTLADAILDRIVHDSYTIFIDGCFEYPLWFCIFSALKIRYIVDSEAMYIPLSAKAGTTCDGGESAYSGIDKTLSTLLYSSTVSLFEGSGLSAVGLPSSFILPYIYHLS